MMPQGQPRPMAGQQLQQPTPTGQFMGQVPGMPQIPQGQPQMAQRATINIPAQQQNQFIQTMMKKLGEQMGQQQISQLNNNPPEQLRAAAAAQGMAPAAYYLKQQAFALFRQKVQQAQQQQQQAQQQGLNLQQRQPGPQPGQLQQQMPPQQQNVRPPPPVPSPAMNRQQPGMPNVHGQQQQGAFPDMYQDQAARAQNAAASGAEVVPASSLPQNMTPTQMQQVIAAQNHARQFSTPANVPQALSNINRPLSQQAGANGLQPGLAPQQQQQMQPGQTPTPQPGQITPAQIISMMPDAIKEKFKTVLPEQRNQFLQQFLKQRMIQQAQQRNNATGPQRAPPGQMGNQPPRPASVSQLPGGAPQQTTQQPPLPPMPANFSLTPQQIAMLDTKEVNPKNFGPAIAAQVPPTVKTWGDIKRWAANATNTHPQLPEAFRQMQLKLAWQQQASQMRAKGMLSGANPAAAQQQAQGQRPSQPALITPTLNPQQLQQLVQLQKAGRQLSPQQLEALNHNIRIYSHNQAVHKAAQAARAQNATPQQQLQQLQKPPGPSPIPVGKPIPQPSQQQPNMTPTMPPTSGPQQVSQVPTPQQQQQPNRPQSTVQMGQQQSGAVIAANEQQINAMFETITKMIDEERKNPELTKKPAVPLSEEEKQKLREQFNDPELKNLVKRINQLLPMFVFLKGPIPNAKELARAVS